MMWDKNELNWDEGKTIKQCLSTSSSSLCSETKLHSSVTYLSTSSFETENENVENNFYLKLLVGG